MWTEGCASSSPHWEAPSPSLCGHFPFIYQRHTFVECLFRFLQRGPARLRFGDLLRSVRDLLDSRTAFSGERGGKSRNFGGRCDNAGKMDSVILSGHSQCKIKRKYPINRPEGGDGTISTTSSTHGSTTHGSSFSAPNTHATPYSMDLQTDTTPGEPEEDGDPYYTWRRNAPFLYNSLVVHNLDWPSLVVDFMDDSSNYRIKNGTISHRLLLGTHTSGAETEYAMVAEVRTPTATLYENLATCENYSGFVGARSAAHAGPAQTTSDQDEKATTIARTSSQPVSQVPSLDIKARVVHPGEINRISHVPESSFKFVTQTNCGLLLLFDYSKHPLNPRDLKSAPQMVLSNGHTAEGYGISWHSPNKFASCASDGTVCVWDLNKKAQSFTASLDGIHDGVPMVEPLGVVNVEAIPLNDLEHVPKEESLVCVACDDSSARIVDFRAGKATKVFSYQNGETNCLSFNRFDARIFVTGDSNGFVSLWDVRREDGPIKQFEHHKESISQVEFCNGSAGIFASASHDSTLCIWDLACKDDELRFIHAGHRGPVSDLSWCKLGPFGVAHVGFMLASVGSDNSLHCFSLDFLGL
ncbi:chromatin assembly factor 1 subunit, putative [Theileria equi strain WA]|uniref:Chromatin assembly factor 1 subunit, putative n=1 Tax=Theileria equi strain WA TaxID=1537102 RepID=L1LEH0_THEEQ|nr:chromatin assembly factor 1 subunit, putative [Theileria equi strain WA]EKX73812.1 chromatin assembly factor 1 subunit, putative [Theileria equi strain WA]|eukprot:XP_004833264.1 chromatin assembly factor 1 subunit, putative [Theileria equi strain WA]